MREIAAMRMNRTVERMTNQEQHAEKRAARFAERAEVTERHRAERIARLSAALAWPPPVIDWRDCRDDPAALAHRAERALKRAANRAAHATRVERERALSDHRRRARAILKTLPPPDREVSEKWVLPEVTGEDIPAREVERLLRQLDRASSATMLARSRGPELADAVALAARDLLQLLPHLAGLPGGEPAPPFARLAHALSAPVDELAQALYDGALDSDIEQVRVLLRTRQPLVLPST